MELEEAEEMAWTYLSHYNLDNWGFEFDNAKRRYGQCRYRTKTISLSRELTKLNSRERVRNTILHEIAHAFTRGHKHDTVWRNACVEVGCEPKRTSNGATIKRPYTAICGTCGNKSKGFRRNDVACKKCCNEHNEGKYDKKFKLKWVKNGNK